MSEGAQEGSASLLARHPMVEQLVAAQVEIATSLPDTWLVPLMNAIDETPSIRHIRVAREEDGVAISAGASLAGVRAVVVCQSAGLLLSVNALAGFAHHHQLPMVLVVAHRGGLGDGYYYHVYKQRVATKVLDAVGIPYHIVASADEIHIVGDAIRESNLHRRPVAVLCGREALRGG